MTATIETGVPFAAYLEWPEMSQSVLKCGRASMAHLKAAIDGTREVKVTDAMLAGSALHTALLEPDSILDRVVLWNGGTRRGKEWDAFRADHADKIILTPGYHARVKGAIKSLRAHPVVREWMGKIEAVEVSARGTLHGVPFKARTDALTSDPLVDLKFTKSCDPSTFTKTVLTFGYYLQGAVYKALFGRDRFLLVAVEDKPPHDCVAYELSPSMLRHGAREVETLIEQYQACLESDHWPGRSDDTVTLELPDWIADQSACGITIGGAAAFNDTEDE